MLSKIVQDQITRHTRKELGIVKIPLLKALVYKETQLVSSPDNANLVWNKRSYKLNRNNNLFISRDNFLDTSEYITNNIMSPTSDGSLSDNNIGVNSNIEYAVEVFSKIDKSQTFEFSMSNGSYATIYQKDNNSDGSFNFHQLTNQSTGGFITIKFLPEKWTGIFIYYYTSLDNGFINGFSPLIQIIDSWRVPDVEPPPIPEWDTIALTTGTNSLTGVTSNTLHWKIPDSKDWNGNGIYRYQEDITSYAVTQQYPDPSLNAILLNTDNLNTLGEFPAGTGLFLN